MKGRERKTVDTHLSHKKGRSLILYIYIKEHSTPFSLTVQHIRSRVLRKALTPIATFLPTSSLHSIAHTHTYTRTGEALWDESQKGLSQYGFFSLGMDHPHSPRKEAGRHQRSLDADPRVRRVSLCAGFIFASSSVRSSITLRSMTFSSSSFFTVRNNQTNRLSGEKKTEWKRYSQQHTHTHTPEKPREGEKRRGRRVGVETRQVSKTKTKDPSTVATRKQKREKQKRERKKEGRGRKRGGKR